MKRVLFAIIAMASLALPASAQKFALVDMEYILGHIPAYERAGEQLNQVSRKWQAEVDALQQEAQTMYKKYQAEAVFLSDEQKVKSEEGAAAYRQRTAEKEEAFA